MFLSKSFMVRWTAVALFLTTTVSMTQAQNLLLDLNAGFSNSFASGSGNTWTDISGSGNNASGVGYGDPSNAEDGWTGTSFTSGFNSGKHFSIPAFSGAANNAGTVEIWFDLDGGNPGGTPQNLFDIVADGEGRLAVNDNKFEWRHKGCGGNSCIKEGSVVTGNVPQQVVLTSDGSTLSVYVDGALAGSNGNGDAWLGAAGGTDVTIIAGSGQIGINGDLYIARYYDSALSANDVAQNYAAGLTGTGYVGAIPEPSTCLLLVMGIAALTLTRRKVVS